MSLTGSLCRRSCAGGGIGARESSTVRRSALSGTGSSPRTLKTWWSRSRLTRSAAAGASTNRLRADDRAAWKPGRRQRCCASRRRERPRTCGTCAAPDRLWLVWSTDETVARANHPPLLCVSSGGQGRAVGGGAAQGYPPPAGTRAAPAPSLSLLRPAPAPGARARAAVHPCPGKSRPTAGGRTVTERSEGNPRSGLTGRP
jgi:hypothetical protein